NSYRKFYNSPSHCTYMSEFSVRHSSSADVKNHSALKTKRKKVKQPLKFQKKHSQASAKRR
ncbi:hypothetical protein, partial [Pseudomonas paralactis]|uniref:hypothetical protein n=1 Tax=Pseudomonas paralactis TaxID=1615673 RepID=UPI001E51AB3D